MSWIGTTKLEFCSGYNAPPLRQSTMVAFKMVVSVAFSKHVIHYGPQSGFPYCNLTTHIYRAIPIHYLRWGRVNLCPETLTRNQSLYQNAGRLNSPSLSENIPIIYPGDIGITYIN